MTVKHALHHPKFTRRDMLQAGAIGLMGLSMADVLAMRATSRERQRPETAGSVIYIFLSGGLAQQDSFDPKPDASENIRGEFKPIATQTPGIRICEHLPLLAKRSDMWSMVRSLTHSTNDHSAGHLLMMTG